MKEFALPSLGADMDEGMLAAWLVEPGEAVSRGQVIAEVETDKGIIEVEIWEDAVVTELLVEPGQTRLPVGTPIARVSAPDDTSDVAPTEVDSAPSIAVPVDDRPIEHHRPAESPDDVHITPPVRHLAHQLGVDSDAIAGSGPNGAVTRADVRAAANGGTRSDVGRARPHLSPRARRLAAERGIDTAGLRATRADGLIVASDVPDHAVADRPARPEPVDRSDAMRRAIARSMERSKQEIPHYYLAEAIDMAAAMTWLEAENDTRSVTKRILPAALLLKATAASLREYPDLNGHHIDGAFVPSERVHLGVAVSLRGGGLVAPAIHDADTLTLDEMMAALTDLVARARAGRLRGSEMTEQTCTVTNLGDRGVDSTFAVIIPPQVAIIGFGRVADTPVAVGDGVAVHPVVHASLAGDHRVTDGHLGGLLLRDIDRRLQEPERL